VFLRAGELSASWGLLDWGGAIWGMFGSRHIVAPPNIWLAKLLVVFLVAHDLVNISKKK
jgi:hypothetical protein